MFLIFWSLLSLSCIGVAIFLASRIIRDKIKPPPFFTPYRVIFIGLYPCVVFALLPACKLLLEKEHVSGMETLLFTLYSSLQVFTANTDSSQILNTLSKTFTTFPSGLYYFYLQALFIAAPVMTFTFLMSLIRNVVPSFRYLRMRKRDTYVFSDLNERSLALAQDLRRTHTSAALVFVGVDKEKIPDQLISAARDIRAICFQAGLEDINTLLQFDKAVSDYRKKLRDFYDKHTIPQAIYRAVKRFMAGLRRFCQKSPLLQRIKHVLKRVLIKLFGHRKNKKKAVTDENQGKKGEPQFYLFAINDDEAENTALALRLAEKSAELSYLKNTKLYLFAADPISELFVQNKWNLFKEIRRVNEVQMLVDHLLYTTGKSLFDHALDCGETKKIHAVFAGMGKYATELIRALSWYCQMDGYELVIDAYSADKYAEDRFSALCPELMDAKYNGKHIDSDALYTINIHSEVAIDTLTFMNSISTIKDATYCFVDLGDDNTNVEAAMKLRMLFTRNGSIPSIHAIVKDKEKARLLVGAKAIQTKYRPPQNHRPAKPVKIKKPSKLKKGALMIKKSVLFKYKYLITHNRYLITGIGDITSFYTEEGVINPALRKAAERCNSIWADIAASQCEKPDEEAIKKQKEELKKQFSQYEYNFRSSMASALHAKLLYDLGIRKQSTGKKHLDRQKLEHRRWEAYMRATGFVHSGKKSILARTHYDLVPYGQLIDVEQEKDDLPYWEDFQ